MPYSNDHDLSLKRGVFCLFCFLSLLTTGCGGNRAKPTNVVVVSIHGLRADHLALYGYERETAPYLTELATRGIVFENAYAAASGAAISQATLLSGQLTPVAGYELLGDVIPATTPMLPSLLQEAGMETIGFISDSKLHPASGFARGFSQYVDCSGNESVSFDDPGMIEIHPRNIMAFRMGNPLSSNALVTGAVSSWLKSREEEKPFFAFVQYSDPLYDYIPPAPFDRMFGASYSGSMTGKGILSNPEIHANMDPWDRRHLEDLYDGEIRWTDRHLRALVSDLSDQGLLSSTLIVITSPFGTSFLEHGEKINGRGVHEHDIHVPLIVVPPKNSDKESDSMGLDASQIGHRVSGLVSLIDVAPTLLDMLGLPPLSHGLGRSLRPSIEGEPVVEGRVVYAEIHLSQAKEVACLRRGDTKIMTPRIGRKLRVFDLSADPGEKKPRLVDAESKEASDLSHFRSLLERMGAWQAEQSEPIPQDLVDGLAAYGFQVGDSR